MRTELPSLCPERRRIALNLFLFGLWSSRRPPRMNVTSHGLDLDFPRKALEVFACLNPSKVITLPNFLDEEAEDEAPDELF